MTPSARLAVGRRKARWTRETIITKITDWNVRYGEPPGSADWNPSLARWRAQEWRAERYYDGEWPSTNAVKRAFDGSFDAAVIAAGFEPARPGPRRASGAARPDIAQRAPQVGGPNPRVPADARAFERRAVAAERRAERAEERLREARKRARLANDRAGRARRARDRALVEADTRVRAALDQADAATREVQSLRAQPVPTRPVGPGPFTDALRAVVRARSTGDRPALRAALTQLAAAATGWRDRL